MKTNYIIKTFFTAVVALLLSNQANAQFRIIEVDPSTERVKIKNFGSTTDDISSYRLCARFSYNALSNMTLLSGDLVNFAPNAEVEVTVSFSNGNVLTDASSDLAIYLPTGNFGTAANMTDFVQWGAGGIGRESQAVANGFWTAGTFIAVAPPYQFNGTATDFGVASWDTLLSVDELNDSRSFKLYPNPVTNVLSIELTADQTNLNYQVFDILGKQVIAGNTNSEDLSQIDVSNLNNGLYLIKISTGDTSETKRFIKK